MKKLLAFLMLMILVIGLTGCNLVGYDENMDNSQIVAKVNGKDITKGEWKEFRTSLANYYQQYYLSELYHLLNFQNQRNNH